MASEKSLERQFQKRCPGLALKITCPSRPGVPDRLILLPDDRVRWVELKAMERYPVRGLFRPGVSAQQAAFLFEWEQRGGVGWLLVQVARDYLLFDATGTRALVAGVPLAEVDMYVVHSWINTSPWNDLWEKL